MKARNGLLMMFCAAVMMLVTGCTVIDSGPAMMKTTMSGITSIAGPLVAKMDPTQITAGADGAVNDPRFRFSGHMGPAWVYEFELSLIGADASFDVDAAGTGRESVDPEVMAFVQQTWADNRLPEEVRRQMITEAVLRMIENKANGVIVEPEPTTQPD